MTVTQTARPIASGTLLAIQLHPTSLSIDGVDVDAPPELRIEATVDTSGKIDIADAPARATDALDGIDLSKLLGESAPTLPDRGLRIGESWPASSKGDGPNGGYTLTGSATLFGYRLESGRVVAVVKIDRRGPVVRKTQIARAPVTIRGTSQTRTEHHIDVDTGYLISSSSRSSTRLRVSLPSQRPSATIDIEQRSSMSRVAQTEKSSPITRVTGIEGSRLPGAGTTSAWNSLATASANGFSPG